MKKVNITKIISIILLFSIVTRFGFVLIHLDHDCSHDDDCVVCSLFHNFVRNFDGIDPNMSQVTLDVCCLFFIGTICLVYKTINKRLYSLFKLKVELIN